MANGRVEFAVSATPIFSHSAGEGSAADVIATDVGKSVGGNGSVTVTWGTTGGYSGGAPIYLDIINGSSNNSYITISNAKFVYIRHTGCVYDTASTLGVPTSATLELTIGDTGLDESVIAVLPAGGALVIPFAVAKSVSFGLSASSGHIAVEYFYTA